MAVNLLLSYAYHSKTDLAEVRKLIGPNQKLMIDSGAFTAYTLGKPIELSQYLNFLKKWEGVYDYAITLDVIGDPKETANNLRTLQKANLSVLPVYTATAKIEELKALAKDYDYLAFGGVVGTPRSLKYPATYQVVKVAGELGARVHALGQANSFIFKQARAYSGDSSNAFRGKWGMVMLWDWENRKERVFAFGAKRPDFGKRKISAKDRKILEAYDFPFSELSDKNFDLQTFHNTLITYGLLMAAIMEEEMRQGGDRPTIYTAVSSYDKGDVERCIELWENNNFAPPIKAIINRSKERKNRGG
jgi:hypothetical protein